MLEKVIESCKYVERNLKHVVINYDIIDKFIEKIDIQNERFWLCNNPYNLFEMGIDNVINFMVIFESIDYSFFGDNKWTISTKYGLKDGCDALLYLLLNYVKENSLEALMNITFEEFKILLKGVGSEIPLLEERYDTLSNVCKIIKEKMNGNFYEYTRDVTEDTKLLDIIVSNFNSFKDERTYNGKTIYFYKLAQLLVSDILHVRELLENVEVDLKNLVGCADYKIPQVFRTLNFTSYDEELSNIVDNKYEIDVSSHYEVEIRASQIVIIDYIKSKLKDVNMIDINDYFFTYSKKLSKDSKPYHLCRNVNY